MSVRVVRVGKLQSELVGVNPNEKIYIFTQDPSTEEILEQFSIEQLTAALEKRRYKKAMALYNECKAQVIALGCTEEEVNLIFNIYE